MNFPRWALLFALFIFLPFFLFAGDIEITVEDEDLGWPLEGAEVLLRGDGRQFESDVDGKVRFDLPNGQQTVVQISYPGYGTKRLTVTAQEGAVQRVSVQLQLGGVMMGRELVVEAERPETSETKSGRSVAISDRELARTAEIGIIEDVMNSVKLLPGVGYSGMFGATPSIRGGDPGDLMAVFDGFYLERPYHWVGAISIFDPKMVSSARLSHGVFSSRYGHTVSGLLEITSKSPSSTETEIETAIGSSAASLNLSIPLNGKGGILFMGKVTYWDTLVWAAQALSTAIDDKNETLAMIHYVETSPYIRSAAVSMNYRFTPDLEWRLNSFFGSDGVGAKATTQYGGEGIDEGIDGHIDIAADYNNYQGFLITGITASPSNVLAIKATGGVGFMKTVTEDKVNNEVTVKYNDDFLALFPDPFADDLRAKGQYTAPDANVNLELDHTIFNAQLRGDVDWELGNGFITAFGVQELYSLWQQDQDIAFSMQMGLNELGQFSGIDRLPGYDKITPYDKIIPDEVKGIEGAEIFYSWMYPSNTLNHGLTTSAYGLLEYTTPDQRFGVELGLRLDHLYLMGNGFTAQTMPALNPRLNFDFNILKNRGYLDSLDLTLGTGLFSSTDQLISFIDEVWDRDDLKFTRSWTSIAGVKMDIAQSYSFNIEGYYKRIFDRSYITVNVIPSPIYLPEADIYLLGYDIIPNYHFDGVGNVGGFDLQLQKLEARYWDGWISYSFTWAKYYDPSGGGLGLNMDNSTEGVGAEWYYPSFHRFHNCNIVLNIKPTNWFNITNRFGFASGQESTRTLMVDGSEGIEAYPVVYINEKGEPEIIQKYRRKEQLDENGKPITVTEREKWAFPWDIKFSFFLFDHKGRVTTEIYLAAENLMALFPKADSGGNTRFNDYTGKEDPSGGGGMSGFDLPIPLISFGFKWRY